MSKNPFIIFGVDENTVNQNELYEAYRALRAKYEDDRFLEGEAGENAARKISEIDQAYSDANEILATRTTVTNGKVTYEEIEAKIREKAYNDAQAMLDSVTNRDAEWHFLQSVIYYKKGWVSESYNQLKKAVEMDPTNQKYRSSYEKLRVNFEGPRPNTNNTYQQGQGAYTQPNYDNNGYGRSYSAGGRPADGGTCDICSTLCALDCCCEMMGGDFISCC